MPSRFKVQATENSSAAAAVSSFSSIPVQLPHTVVIVDDDDSVREALTAIVSTGGWNVKSYASAERFLTSGDEFTAACLILDLRLPGMSGFELQERLARDARSIPTIVITGFGDVPQAVRAMKNGAITFLEKPIHEKILLSAVADAVKLSEEAATVWRKKEETIARFTAMSSDEHAVLRLVLEGHPNKRIASELDKGLRTIELRRSNIMKKSGASSLAELIRFAILADIL